MSKHVSSYDEGAPLPKVGTEWVWRGGDTIRVEEVRWNAEEWWVMTRRLRLNPPRILAPFESSPVAWNDLSVFWEAVTPATGTKRGKTTRAEVRQGVEFNLSPSSVCRIFKGRI